jgi:hypothetical protein
VRVTLPLALQDIKVGDRVARKTTRRCIKGCGIDTFVFGILPRTLGLCVLAFFYNARACSPFNLRPNR